MNNENLYKEIPMKDRKKTTNNAIVMLSDGETWAADGFVRILAGDYPVDDADDIESLEIVEDIPVSALLAAYNVVHGTSY